MNILFKCCLGSPATNGANSDAQHLEGRALALPKEPSIRGRSLPVQNLPQACAAACMSLPNLSCDQWPQRIAGVLANLESSLRCSVRLVIYSSDGFPWVFAPIDWFAEESDRIKLTHLADVLIHQADDAVAIVRHPRDSAHNIFQVISWSSDHTLVLDPGDYLALPVGQPCTQSTAALLLSWDRPPETLAWSAEKHNNTTLSASDLKELRRLALFVGYGLLGDPQHARYVQRVCRHLALMPSAPSLHDLIIALLDGVHDLVQTKFGIQFQAVLATVHGTSAPAIFFVQRPSGGGGGGGPLRPCASEAHIQISGLLNTYGSNPGGTSSSRAYGTLTPAALDTAGSINTIMTGNGGCARQEPSQVRAIKTSLVHTLLLQTLKSSCTTVASSREPAGVRDGSSRFSQRPSTNDGGGSRGLGDVGKTNGSGVSCIRGCIAAATGRRPSRSAALLSVIVPNASSHVLEDQQPCRDVLVCSKLTGGKVGSMMLLAEGFSTCAAAQSPEPHLLMLPPYSPSKGCLPAAAAAAALVVGEEETFACTIRCSDAGRSAGGGASATPAAALAAAMGVRQTPYQLALYLMSSEVLPAGVLRMISDELQSLLLMFFGAWRSALDGYETGCNQGCMVAEWRRLQEQLLGQPNFADGTGSSGIGLAGLGVPDPSGATAGGGGVATAAMAPAAPATILESASNSPLIPMATTRSAVSSRLFKCNAQASPLPASSANNAATLLPAYCGGNGSQPLPPAAGSPGRRALVGSGSVNSQGGGLVRRGLLTLLATRDDATGCTSQHAMPGLAAAVGAGDRGFKFSNRSTVGSPNADTGASHFRTDPAASLHLGTTPQVTLEKPAGASALDMLVTSIRHGLSAAGGDGHEEQAVQAQDLAAVQLLEVLGRGGQGVVFRGSLHGLETAVKVLTGPSGGGGGGSPSGDARGAPAAGAAAAATPLPGEAANGEAAAAAGARPGGGSSSGMDTWDVDSKAGEARMRQAKRGAMEVAVIGTLSHPSIVQVYATFTGVVVVRCQYHDSPDAEMRLCYPTDELLAGKDPGPLNQVICLEYCDGGTLLSAARAGAFRLPFALPSNGAAFPALVPLYKSLLEVALALRYLHTRKLVHCDVKAANVLLKSSNRDMRGWTCKLSDFGCARMLTETEPNESGEGMGPVGFRTAAPVGTLAHMAPECFIKNCILTVAVDIYSFGIMMWELLMCTTPYAGLSAKDIPRQVTRQQLRPNFHPLAPPDYCALAAWCWSSKPDSRPTAMGLVNELEHLLAAAQASSEREAQVAAAAAATRGIAPARAAATTGAAADDARAPRKLPPDVGLGGGGGGKIAPAPLSVASAHEAQKGDSGALKIQTAVRRLLHETSNQQESTPSDQSTRTLTPTQQQHQEQQPPGHAAVVAQNLRATNLGGASPSQGRQSQQQQQQQIPGKVVGSSSSSAQGQVNQAGQAAKNACRPPSTFLAGSPRMPVAGRDEVRNGGVGGGNDNPGAESSNSSNSSSGSSDDDGGGHGSGRSEVQGSAICLLPFTNQDTI